MVFFLISSVSSYTIICSDESRGVQIWNLNQTFSETGWTLGDLEGEEGLNCTLIESSITLREDCQEYEPVINQLNQNLRNNYEENQTLEKKLGRYNFYKLSSIIFLVVSVVLLIFLKVNSRKK